ncbi:hypothetical protein OTK49_03065 [Vibrio coralliirubri]|uniref:hypothetical protein n=1 Tax=Vibrio coralliirubri TaxID=1516159 RepID=UPI0022835AB3|nr:hypothetical protein [Vibrio coralliirubri]MCY9861496.1 hypothetical protein [Vibrio coralliirubri]
MSSVVYSMSAQVDVALQFLSSLPADQSDVRKAFHCINAIHDHINVVKSKLSNAENLQDENTRLLDSISELSSSLSIMKLSENIHLSDMEKLKNQIQQMDVELKKVTSDRARLDKNITTIKREHLKAIEVVKEASKEKSKKAQKKQADRIARLTESEQGLRRQVKEYKASIDLSFGKEATTVAGANEGVRFFLHLYERRLPMVIRNDKHKIKMLEDVHWHFQVMRNNGVAVIALTSEWLTPIFPSCADFDSEWLETGSIVLHDEMMARAKISHPLQYNITLASKRLKLNECDSLLDADKEWLGAARMTTLFDAIGLGFQIFLILIDTAVPDLKYEKAAELFDKLLKIADEVKESHSN